MLYKILEEYKLAWRLFIRDTTRLYRKSNKKRFALIFVACILSLAIFFILGSIQSKLDMWITIFLIFLFLMIAPPSIGLLYSPLYRKYPITSFVLLLSSFLLFFIMWIMEVCSISSI